MSTSVDLCTPLPAAYRYVDPKGEAFTQEYLDAIVDAIVNSDRSLQKTPGPSELGIPCNRLLGYKLLGIPERPRVPAWKATVGTGTHMWLETAFDRYNLQNAIHLDGQERFYIETKVSVGEVNGIEITGNCDLYDRVTGTVVDHKTCSPTALKNYQRDGPPGQYRIQAHLYGRGWIRAGLPVNRVMIAFLPRNGELADAYIWSEKYNEAIAVQALERLAGIQIATQSLGVAALKLLPTEVHYCTRCPYFLHKSTDLERGCPGDINHPANQPIEQDAPFGAVIQEQQDQLV